MEREVWKAGNFVYPVPPALISCQDAKGNTNLITVAWTGTVCTNPPMAYISVRPERHSYGMIRETEEFVINLTTEDMVKAVDYCGVKSGREVNKWEKTGLTPGEGSKVKAPIVMESPVNIECRVTEVKELGSHHMFLAMVEAVQVDPKYLNAEGKFELSKAKPVAWSHGAYYGLSDMIGTFGYSIRKKPAARKKKK